MENFLSAFQQLKNPEDEKYDVLYMNTPWNRLSPSQMSRLSIKDLVKENSLLYIWADTYTMADTVALINTYGYEFESVYQICDIASYPSSSTTTKPRATKEAVISNEKKDDMEVVEVSEDKTQENSEDKIVEVSEDKKEPVKRVKKTRCPPLTSPKYYTTTDRGSSRGTSEYLILAFRGDSSVLTTLSNEKAGTLPYQVVRRPEMGKKSRSVPKKNIYLDPEWQVDRPAEFMETVQAHLKPDVKILEIFGSTVRDNVDALGPNIPGGFSPGYCRNTGITMALNKSLRSMRKVQLQTLVSSLTKMGQTDERSVKVEEFKKVEDQWKSIKKSLSDMKSGVSYDWSSETELPAEWLRLAVLYFSQRNVNDFGNLRRRKKKRTSASGPTKLYGIAAPVLVSDELTEFLGLDKGTMVSRTHVVRLLNQYVKDNKLQDPLRKIRIIPDEKLAALLSPIPEDFGEITYFKLCGLLGSHFPPTKKALAAAEKAAKANGGASALGESIVNVVEEDTVETESSNKKQRTD